MAIAENMRRATRPHIDVTLSAEELCQLVQSIFIVRLDGDKTRPEFFKRKTAHHGKVSVFAINIEKIDNGPAGNRRFQNGRYGCRGHALCGRTVHPRSGKAAAGLTGRSDKHSLFDSITERGADVRVEGSVSVEFLNDLCGGVDVDAAPPEEVQKPGVGVEKRIKASGIYVDTASGRRSTEEMLGNEQILPVLGKRNLHCPEILRAKAAGHFAEARQQSRTEAAKNSVRKFHKPRIQVQAITNRSGKRSRIGLVETSQ